MSILNDINKKSLMYNINNDNKNLSKIVNILQHNHFHSIFDYLSFKDSLNVSYVNKSIKKNYDLYFKHKAPFIIQSLMKKIIILKRKIEFKMLNYDEKSITVKDMAFIYFFFYENKYTCLWLNPSCKRKINIVKKYNFNLKNRNLNKFDLFNCQIIMSKDDIDYLGW